jgi:hypothetical protein
VYGKSAPSAVMSGSIIVCIVNSAPEYVWLSRVNTNDDGFKKFGILVFIHFVVHALIYKVKKTPSEDRVFSNFRKVK